MVVPEFSSLGFEMNTKNYPTDDVNVRKAIAYIIDTEQIAPVSEPGMVKGDEYAVGLPPSIRDKYLSKDFLSTLNNYDSNYEKAEECLKAAGWSKKGEKWVDAKGESPEIVIAGVGEYPAYVVMGEAAANMLNEFGLNASYTSKEAAAYNDYCTSGQGNMTVDGFASATALSSAMIPIVISIVMGHSAEGLNPLGVTMLMQYAICFGLVLPVNSPQGMVAYGTDTFDVKTFMTTGIPLTIIGYVMMLVFALTYWHWIGIA